ncbi:hypothetical protein CRUP_036269 [Coryphaenoides rupestris]|nr:hypothetical protein CRUP_036269 [Coryphaenoides rupestris]
MHNLSTITGLEVHAPAGLATGSFQNTVHVEKGRSKKGASVRRLATCTRACCRGGHFLWDRVSLEDVCVSPPLTDALTEGLAALHRHTESRPLKSLSLFLARRSEEVYYEPLTAAVDSNRPIISHASAHVILSPVERILQLNRVFLRDLGPRLASWGPRQCVGDVCVKLCSKLRLYTTYLHQYPTALTSVDTALSLHTLADHPDRTHLDSALRALTGHREFIRKNLCEGDRQLIMTADAALLKSSGDDIPDCLRTYEQVCDLGLFLFSDALVLTKRSVRHAPFTLALRSTHTFLASVALACLDAREITHSRSATHSASV